MSNHEPKPKRSKFIHTWFKRTNVESSSSNVVSEPSISSPNIDVEPQPSIPEPQNNINALERDPGLRCAIWKYPVNERDSIRKTYVLLGPFQPELEFPFTEQGSQQRRFQFSWFKSYPWLEYSIALDKAYCFPCFLFDTEVSHHPAFTIDGFKAWKRVSGSDNVLMKHVGGLNSPHHAAMQKWDLIRNPTKQIETVFQSKSLKDIEDNRLRLKASIESVRLLANQGAAFRGHDETEDSLNAGHFREVIKSFSRMSVEVERVVLGNAPGNAKYISPSIQKQLLNILGNKVRNKIREEVGDSKYCILVDEAVDTSSKEQMAIILRFVDCQGIIRERFFKIVSVPDTTSQTLKDEISKVLTMYNLQVRNMRGQGYDGASNMRGIYNGLQALFLEECPYAYYVHCFAHRLQLTLNATAKGVHDIWQFFSTLSLIVNFVDSSAKRHSALKAVRKEEIADLVACGQLQTGTGANQVCTLQRAAATRWSSHFRSIKSLIELFSSTKKLLMI
ncbi:hypothetical protein ABKV19_010172 [Rosa sericea]